MTGLRQLKLCNSQDHLLVAHLLLLLQGQCCAGLESLIVWPESRITAQQLCELLRECSQLHTLTIYNPTCKATPDTGNGTDEGVLALAAHCRQLRELYMPYITLTKETVRQLAQHCRRLTRQHVNVYEREGEVMLVHRKQYTCKEIRALR